MKQSMNAKRPLASAKLVQLAQSWTSPSASSISPSFIRSGKPKFKRTGDKSKSIQSPNVKQGGKVKVAYKLDSYVHSCLNQKNVSVSSIKKRKYRTEVHVSQSLVALRAMEAGKYGKSMHSTQVGFPTFSFNEVLCMDCVVPYLEIFKWLIRKGQS
jgi:hypothetical protein